MDLDKLKTLLGVSVDDKTNDTALQFIIDAVIETILNYCNLKDLPIGLINTAYRMAIDLYRYDRPGEAGVSVIINSVSEGDTSTSFTSATDALAGGILKDYQGQLNRYRKVAW